MVVAVVEEVVDAGAMAHSLTSGPDAFEIAVEALQGLKRVVKLVFVVRVMFAGEMLAVRIATIAHVLLARDWGRMHQGSSMDDSSADALRSLGRAVHWSLMMLLMMMKRGREEDDEKQGTEANCEDQKSMKDDRWN